MIGSINVIGGITGLTDGKLSVNELLIFPNSAVDFIYFNAPILVSPHQIFTTHGKLVMSGTTNTVINVSTLKNGTYHLDIIGDKPHIL
jgi:hypothetical protein